MNLHGVVNPAIRAINPNRYATLQLSTGSITAADGHRAPSYADPVKVTAQVQQLTTRDLMHLDALNIQGSSRKIYLSGQLQAIMRVSQKGGDLVTLANGDLFLTTAVLEQWNDGETPSWVCVAVTLQNQTG